MSDKKLSVTIATADAIITSESDPYLILVGYSDKHKKYVLPGGKVELPDMIGNDPGMICILREVQEEVGTAFRNPRYIGVATDPKRDVRTVPYKKIKTAATNPKLPKDLSDDTMIEAAYGCPGRIYVGTVREAAIKSTEELKKHTFVDIRTMQDIHTKQTVDLAVGHDVMVMWYRHMLETGATMLPRDAMQDFETDRKKLAAMRPQDGGNPSASSKPTP